MVITVIGLQRDAYGEENKIELFTHGRYHHKYGVHYITYKDTELSGMEETTTLLKIFPGYVVLVRMGPVEQRQEFRIGERCSASYITPYGAMDMSVLTTSLELNLMGEDGGASSITIEYELEIEGQWQSANTLSITIQGAKKNGH